MLINNETHHKNMPHSKLEASIVIMVSCHGCDIILRNAFLFFHCCDIVVFSLLFMVLSDNKKDGGGRGRGKRYWCNQSL